jgi:hypothetical protein
VHVWRERAGGPFGPPVCASAAHARSSELESSSVCMSLKAHALPVGDAER